MPTPKFTCRIAEGRITVDRPELYTRFISRLKGRYELTIKPERKERSNDQNRYYWGVVIEILSNELGYSSDETHEALKWVFLKNNDGRIPTVRSTSDLSTVEFENYMSNVRLWAAKELNIQIPEPNEVSY